MSDETFKSELLKQNGKAAVDEEVGRLRAIIAAEQRRVRRLTFWTVGVWAVWFLMISLSLGVPLLAKHSLNAAPPQGATQPAVPARVADHSPSGLPGVIALIFAMVCFAAFLGLPVAGIVLAIMLITSRRTASLNQVRASLASIDAQLRMLGAPGVKI